MKSAYELAMERLEAAGEKTIALTPEQKEQLAEVDRKFAAKIAEREIFLKEQLVRASDREAYEQLTRQLVSEKARLADEREAAKEGIRNS